MNKEIMLRAIKVWGKEAQVKKAVEEMAECMIALLHEADGKSTTYDIATEIADVEIMMGQMKEIFQCHEQVESEKRIKWEKVRIKLNSQTSKTTDYENYMVSQRMKEM